MTIVLPSMLALLSGGVFFLVGGVMGYVLSEVQQRKEDFTHYRGQIVVVDSEMLFGKDEKGRTVSVVGILKNNTQIPWEHVQVEVRFFDGGGRLIDAGLDDRLGGAIPPGAENAFKVVLKPNLPDERYASYKVFVRYAEDAGHLF